MVQNEGMRIVLGNCPTSTPINAMSNLTKIPSLETQRKERLLQLWKRIMYNPKNPARKVYQKFNWHPSRKILKRKRQPKTPIAQITNQLLSEIGVQEADMVSHPFSNHFLENISVFQTITRVFVNFDDIQR